MPEAPKLTPFLEPENPDDHVSARYIAGFKNHLGEHWGTVIPLDREHVDRLVLTATRFQPRIEVDGTAQAWPDAEVVDDGVFEAMLKGGLLPMVPLDELVAEAIDLNRNEPSQGEDGVLPDFASMRKRLAHALQLVDAEIARRSGRTSP
jgi:hypothetical protein